jgi:hypothetical protein
MTMGRFAFNGLGFSSSLPSWVFSLFPPLAAAAIMLLLDRHLGTSFLHALHCGCRQGLYLMRVVCLFCGSTFSGSLVTPKFT